MLNIQQFLILGGEEWITFFFLQLEKMLFNRRVKFFSENFQNFFVFHIFPKIYTN